MKERAFVVEVEEERREEVEEDMAMFLGCEGE